MGEIDVRYFRVLFGPASADMNLSISKRPQDERNGANTYGDFENEIIFNANVLQMVTILSQSFSELQKIKILNLRIYIFYSRQNTQICKIREKFGFLMTNEKTLFVLSSAYGCFAG